MATNRRRWCSKGHMVPHAGTVCLKCNPQGPAPKVELRLAEPLELVPITQCLLPDKPTVLDVIREAGARGATVADIVAAGADKDRLVPDLTDAEMRGLIETRYCGPGTGVRDGATVFYVTERAARAA